MSDAGITWRFPSKSSRNRTTANMLPRAAPQVYKHANVNMHKKSKRRTRRCSDFDLQQMQADRETKADKVYCLSCCADALARASLQNFTQYNGHYGCGWCLHRKKTVDDLVETATMCLLPCLVKERKEAFVKSHARWRQGEEDTRALPMRVTSGSVERPQGAEGGWRIRREVRRAQGLFWWAAGRWDAVTVALGAMVSSVSAAEQRPRRFGASAKASRWLVLLCELCTACLQSTMRWIAFRSGHPSPQLKKLLHDGIMIPCSNLRHRIVRYCDKRMEWDRQRKGYLVKWKGLPRWDSSFEPEENLNSDSLRSF
ncbi:hypothetical protein HPB50_017578 [Hyalomma asiaticum]|uniref:Uncharacterized protein n=1 Tax=Hyalomma asiaticum TaxID=266040 RepID=A0ACB7SG34_HYAAI|nr:hypothetical protein HPB50_017578 [Hyalomma asiaticum]